MENEKIWRLRPYTEINSNKKNINNTTKITIGVKALPQDNKDNKQKIHKYYK